MRLSGRGWAVLASVAILSAGGLTLGWPPLLGLAAAGVVLLLMALVMVVGGQVQSVEAPTSLRIERRMPGSLSFVVRGAGLAARSAVRLRSGRTIVRCSRGRGDELIATIEVDTHRRGVFAAGPWILERVDPWALLQRRLGTVSAAELLVVPRVHSLHPDTVPMLMSERGRARQGTSSLATLREYVIGDELRQVHWRSTAKTGRLMVRQYIDITKPLLVVLVDVDPESYSDADELDETMDVAASIAAAAVGVNVEVRTTAGDRAELTGANRAPMLEMLARARISRGSVRPVHGTVIEVGPHLLRKVEPS